MARGLHVTMHAIERYVLRVAKVSPDEARAALSSPVIIAAADFANDAPCEVRLPTGHRIVIRDHAVVTVKPAENYKRNIRRVGIGRYS